jgi:methyltransferase family protein
VNPAEAFQENSRVWNDMIDHLPFLFESAQGNVMEIGVRGGASTSALLAGVEAHGGHLWSVDVNFCPVFEGHPQWTFTQANSITESERIKAIIPERLDVLFVDGDHTYEGCLSDLQTYGPRADLILIHDCLCPDTYPGVRKASEEYAASLGIPLVIRDGSYGLGVIQKSKGIENDNRAD